MAWAQPAVLEPKVLEPIVLAAGGAATLELLLRGDELRGRRVAANVIVNEANGRFFDPRPGRTGSSRCALRRRFSRSAAPRP